MKSENKEPVDTRKIDHNYYTNKYGKWNDVFNNQNSQSSELQKIVNNSLSDWKLTPDELKNLTEWFEQEKNKITEETKNKMQEFLRRNTKTMLEWLGYPVWINLERDLKILETLWYDISWLREIINRTKYDPKIDWTRYVWLNKSWNDWNKLFLRREWEWTWYSTSDIDLIYTKEIQINYNKELEEKNNSNFKKEDSEIVNSWNKNTDAKQTKKESKNTSVKISKKERIWNRELIKWETGIVSWNNVRIRNKDWKYSWNENVNKWDELILTWEKIKLPKWIYYGIEMEDGSIWYIHSRYIKLDKKPKIEKDTSKETLENAKKSLQEAVKSAKEMLKNDKKDLEKIKAVDKKISDKLSEIDKLLATNATIDQINKASEELEKLIKERQELLKKMENSGKKLEEKIDKVQEITKWWGYSEKVEKWEKVVVAEYKVIWRNEHNVDLDTPGHKYDKKTWTYYTELLYENDFELYKKESKYILEMNWSWVFSDETIIFDKIPTKDELKKKIDEMSKKYMDWDSRKFELKINL